MQVTCDEYDSFSLQFNQQIDMDVGSNMSSPFIGSYPPVYLSSMF